jgi:phage-related minor tail protein
MATVANETVTKRLQIVATSTGVDKLANDLEKLGAATRGVGVETTKTNTTTLGLGRQFEALERRVNPLLKLQQQFERDTRLVNNALAQNAALADRAARAHEGIRTRYEAAVAATKKFNDTAGQTSNVVALNSHAMRNLGFQLNDTVTMLASGSSPFQVLATQGGQVVQALQGPQGITGSLKQLGGSLMSLVTPGRLAFGGLTAAAALGVAAWNSYDNKVKDVQRSLNGLGGATGATSSRLNAIAMGPGPLGFGDAMSGASRFAAAGINVDLYSRLNLASHTFSRGFGKTVPEAQESLAAAFADPMKGVQDLAKTLGPFALEITKEITRLQSLGKLEESQIVLYEALNDRLKGVIDTSSVLSRAWESIRSGSSNAWARLGAVGVQHTPVEAFRSAAQGEQMAERLGRPEVVEQYRQRRIAAEARMSQEEIDAEKRRAAALKIRMDILAEDNRRISEFAKLGAANLVARSAADKLAIEQERIRREAIFDTSKANTVASEVERARTLAVADATRVLSDYKRAAADENFLGGARTERDRYMRQLQIETRGLREGVGGLIPDSEWRSQVKWSERAENLFKPAPISPFGTLPTGISKNISLKRLNEAGGARPVDVTKDFGPRLPRIAANNAPGPVDTSRLENWDRNKFGQMMHDAEEAIKSQNRALETQIASFGKSTEEFARFNEQTRMQNDLARTGIPLTKDRADEIARIAEEYGRAAAAQERFRETLASLNDMRAGFMDVGNSMVSAFMRGERGVKLLQAGVNSLTNSLQRMSMRMLDKALFGNSDMSGGLLGSIFSSFMGGGGGITASANGNIFAGGNVIPFARGGVVSSPTLFPMANGAGLMGEAGPEAIMPLRRGPDGRLGVSGAGGGGGGVVIINENHTRTASMETKQEKGPDGRTIIRQIIREEVGGMIASGDTDSANRARYGIQARKVMRG